MKRIRILFLFCLFLIGIGYAQSSKSNGSEQWIKVHDDEMVTIYYDFNIVTDKRGRHIVWVKAVYHSLKWQQYFTNLVGCRETVTITKTKAMYDNIYSYVMVRQVQCFNKAGKKLYDSGDDPEGDWGLVNASDPVGIVGEYLDENVK